MKLSTKHIVMVALLAGGACSSGTQIAQDTGPAADTVPTPDMQVPDTVAPDTTVDAPQPELLAGAAVVDLTPAISEGVPLAGFGAAPRREISIATIPAHIAAATGSCFDPSPGSAASLFTPAEGQYDPITARALVIDNGDKKVGIIALDMIATSRQVRDDVAAFAQTLGIASEDLMIGSSHTHSGPGALNNQTMWEIIAADCFHAATYADILSKIKTALQQAHDARRPAKIGFGTTLETRVSENRRDEPGVFDPELGLIKVVEKDTDAPIAAVMNFAVHGTCLGSSNLNFSADIMGFAERDLETQLGSGAVALFLNGAEGDVSPKNSGLQAAEDQGGILADTSMSLWSTVSTVPWVEMKGSLSDLQMPTPVINGCPQLAGGVGQGTETLCDLIPGLISLNLEQWVQPNLYFGAISFKRPDGSKVVLAGIPGEAITDIGLAVKTNGANLGYQHTFVVGLANDHGSYIVTDNRYQSNTYEAQGTIYGPNTGSTVINEVTNRMDAVK